MDLPDVHANSSAIPLRLLPLTFLFCLSSLSSVALGQQVDHNKPWLAKVTCDDVPVYSQMSIESMIVKYLRGGDVVAIDLEIVGSDPPWSLVRQEGRKVRLGFVQSECLETTEPPSFTKWQSQSPRPRLSSTPDSDLRSTEPPAARPLTREEIDEEVQRAVAAALSRMLSAASIDQNQPAGNMAFESQDLVFVPFQTGPFLNQGPFFLPRPLLRFNRFGRFLPLTEIRPSFTIGHPPPGRFSAPHSGPVRPLLRR
jgi:hypothetical protein